MIKLYKALAGLTSVIIEYLLFRYCQFQNKEVQLQRYNVEIALPYLLGSFSTQIK